MQSGDIMYQSLIFLLAAIISVPIAKRLGFGSVLGYLIAGIVIGPYALALVGQDVKSIMHFAEFGVVMMLFLVGLELQPKVLWKMRMPIIGLGGLQVIVTAGVLCLVGVAIGFPWQTSLAVGLILSLSSTAIVLQSMNEKGLMSAESGQSAFAVLLFQDIAVIPMLALLPLLAVNPDQVMALPLAVEVGSLGVEIISSDILSLETHTSEVAASGAKKLGLVGWQYGILVISVVVALVAAGHFLVRPFFRFVAQTKLREIFTATALALVIGISMIMEWVGLSAALGAFIAGVVLAENEYRHELEAEIQPFKSLLLGVFFITVGASINFSVLMQQPLVICQLLAALVLIKVVILYGLARLFKLQRYQQSTFSYALAHSGEFCFVLFSFTDKNNILPDSITVPLVVVVALSMAITPLLMIFNDKFVLPQLAKRQKASDQQDKELPPEVSHGHHARVLIAGFGRFGQVINRSLNLAGISTTVLETDPDQVNQLRKFGHKVYYGDLSRLDLLEAAGAAQAELIVIAADDHDKVKAIVSLCRKYYPNLRLFARATGRLEASELNLLGVDVFVRETFHSALYMSEKVLGALGMPNEEAKRILITFTEMDEMHVREIVDFIADEKSYISQTHKNKAELEKVLQFAYDDLVNINSYNKRADHDIDIDKA